MNIQFWIASTGKGTVEKEMMAECNVQEGQQPEWVKLPAGSNGDLSDSFDYPGEFDGKFDPLRLAHWRKLPGIINRSFFWVIVKE
jgi:hypothetical protein